MTHSLLHPKTRLAQPVLALCAVAIAFAATWSAVSGWRSATDKTRARSAYLMVRAGAAHEEAFLRQLRAHPKSAQLRSAFFDAAQTETNLFARVSNNAPSSQQAIVRSMERLHTQAVATAARAAGSGSAGGAAFARALHQLEQIEFKSATAQGDLSIAAGPPWPSTTLQRVGLGDLVLVLLVGGLVFTRRVLI